MILYLLTILISAIIIGVFNGIFNLSAFSAGVPQLIALIIAGIIFQFVVDGAFAIFGRLLPSSLFSPKCSIYNVSNRERKFYEFIKIRKWKDKVWELGGLGGFRKNKIADSKSAEYLYKFIEECNRGIIVHVLGVAAGFLLLVVFPQKYSLCVSLPIAIVNAILNILPIFILRYNVPKLKVAYNRACKQAVIQSNEDEEVVTA